MQLCDFYKDYMKSLVEYRSYWLNYRGQLAMYMTEETVPKEKQLKIVEEIHRVGYLLDEINTLITKTQEIKSYGSTEEVNSSI